MSIHGDYLKHVNCETALYFILYGNRSFYKIMNNSVKVVNKEDDVDLHEVIYFLTILTVFNVRQKWGKRYQQTYKSKIN